MRLGATSPTTGGDCPAGGDWNAWCDCMFSGNRNVDPNLAKCKAPMIFAPWTELGALARGIPHYGTKVLPNVLIDQLNPGGGAGSGANQQQQGQVDPSGEGIFGIPKTMALVGGGVVLLGTVAFFATRKKKARTA